MILFIDDNFWIFQGKSKWKKRRTPLPGQRQEVLQLLLTRRRVLRGKTTRWRHLSAYLNPLKLQKRTRRRRSILCKDCPTRRWDKSWYRIRRSRSCCNRTRRFSRRIRNLLNCCSKIYKCRWVACSRVDARTKTRTPEWVFICIGGRAVTDGVGRQQYATV